MSFQVDNWDIDNFNLAEMVKNFFTALQETGFVLVLLAILLFFIMALILSFVARASMLRGISGAINSNTVGSFMELFKYGFSKAPKIILMELIYLIPSAIAISLMLLLLVLASAFSSKIIIIGVLSLFLYFLLISFFRVYAYCCLIFENVGPWTAIKSGWQLFTNNFSALITAGVLKFALLIAAGLATLIVLVVAILPLVLVGVLILILIGQTGLYVLIGIGLLALLIVFMVVRGFLNTFFYAYTVFVYRQVKGE